MEEKNFLEDPDLYFDELPQPFHFLHKLIDRILDAAWDQFLSSEQERREHSNLDSFSVDLVSQTEIPDEITFVDLVATNVHSEGEETMDSNKMLLMANRVHLLYFPVSCSYQTEEPAFQHKLPAEPLKQLHVLLASDRCSLVRGRDVQEHVQYHFLAEQEAHSVCCIPDADSVRVSGVMEEEPYITLTCSENEETFLLVYSYPFTQWTETAAALLSLQGEEPESNKQMPAFTKPSLIAKISKPQPLQPTNLFDTTDPAPFSDPKAYFNGVGHPISPEFFRNQSALFQARRQAFESDLIGPTSVRLPLTSPHSHTVLSEAPGSRKEVVVWWGGGADLFIYSFPTTPKDTNVYPVSYMNFVHRILCSSISSAGDILVLAFPGSLTVWKFPHRILLKYLRVGDFGDVSLIRFMPSLSLSGTEYKDKFVCCEKNKIYAVDVDRFDTKLTLLNQTEEPVLPRVLAFQALFLSPNTHLVLFSHADGVRSVRNLAASPVTLTVLRSDRDSPAGLSSHLRAEDRQLFLVAGAAHLLRYDLSRVVRKVALIKTESEPAAPTQEQLRKPLFLVEGNDSIKRNVMKLLDEQYDAYESIKAKAEEVWKELDNFFK